MYNSKNNYLQITVVILALFIISCNSSGASIDKERVQNPSQMNSTVQDDIQQTLETALKNNGKIDDSIRLSLINMVNAFYTSNEYKIIWSNNEKWNSLTDTLYHFIASAETQGLFPKDYHFNQLKSLKHTLDTDSLKKMNATLWTKADLMFTDAFMQIVKDLKQGRLLPDSITLNKDSVLQADFFVKGLSKVLDNKQFSIFLNNIQPQIKEYWDLKTATKSFVDSMDRHTYTYVTYPFKKNDKDDSLYFVKTLQKRFVEGDIISKPDKMLDSLQLAEAVKKYQLKKGIKADGKISISLIKSMNINDMERFRRIAINLDRYKQLPAKMPEKYIWVNLPEYYLRVIDHDTIALVSKVICGKSDTRTPVLNSAINQMISYPTWTIPNSIILKSLLPKLKDNPGYLKRLGYKLVTWSGKNVDPYAVNWEKYKKAIPYSIQQGSGDNNALGIFKFNFNNDYEVYLHDTNQRYLFKNSSRALSHGCVRVQEWSKLAYYIAKNDSINAKPTDTLNYNTDSIKNWIDQKSKHYINVKNKIPIFIRYFTCDVKNGKVKFYDDIYGEDKLLREKYFTEK